MATLTYSTTVADDEIILWELARRAKASKTPPKNGQALLTIEFGHVLRGWEANRKADILAKIQTDPASVTAAEKQILGIP